jgi:hypothetical protein
MAEITAPVPIYKGLLVLASPSERETILKGGPREHLFNEATFLGERHDDATAAYVAIKAILTRLVSDRSLRVTAIDERSIPPKREVIEGEVILTSRLSWTRRDGVESSLLFEWANAKATIINLRIEAVEQPQAGAPGSMSSSSRLGPGERIDDTERLALMQKLIHDGHLAKTAARRAAADQPYPHCAEASTVSRLVKKFNKRKKR